MPETVLERPPEQRGKRDSLKVLSILDQIAKESQNLNQSNTEARER